MIGSYGDIIISQEEYSTEIIIYTRTISNCIASADDAGDSDAVAYAISRLEERLAL